MNIPNFHWSERTCGQDCWEAKTLDCKCSCNGKNHGIWLRGGQPDFRTSKHNGTLYKLLAVGEYGTLLNIQQKELEKYGLYSCEKSYSNENIFVHTTHTQKFRHRGDKDCLHFPVIRKYATPEQIQKWPELSEYKVKGRGEIIQAGVSVLWEIMEKPPQVKHICGIIK